MKNTTLALRGALVVMLFLSLAASANADATAACFVTEANGTCGPSYPPSVIKCADGTQGPSYIQTSAPETSKCANALEGAGGKEECNQTSVDAVWDAYACPGGTWGVVAPGVTQSCRTSQLAGDECTGPKPIEPQEQ